MIDWSVYFFFLGTFTTDGRDKVEQGAAAFPWALSAPESAQAAAEVKKVRGRLLLFLLLMRALQPEQMLVSGGVRQQAGSSYVAYLVPMALLGVLFAYAYSILAKFA